MCCRIQEFSLLSVQSIFVQDKIRMLLRGVDHALPCQNTNVHLHAKYPLMRFLAPDEKCSHIHLDIISSLPLVRAFRYCLTMRNRFSRLTEAVRTGGIT